MAVYDDMLQNDDQGRRSTYTCKNCHSIITGRKNFARHRHSCKGAKQ